MPKSDKTGTKKKENFSFHCVQDDQTGGRKKSETFQKPPVEGSNWAQASGEVHTFDNDLKNHGYRILIFSYKKLSPRMLSSSTRMIGV